MIALLDLPAPVFEAADALLAGIAVPPLLRILIYGALSAMATMWLYGRVSRQKDLAEIRVELAAAHAALARYDGDFQGLLPLIRRSFGLSLRQIGRTLVPALIAGVPLLFVLPWLSNRFSHVDPAPGAIVDVCPLPQAEQPPSGLAWIAIDLPTWHADRGCWSAQWPQPEQSIWLNGATDARLLTLPLAAAVPIVHKRVWWNALMGNPAGYIPDAATFFAVELSLPERELIAWGPSWLRGWEAAYFLALLFASVLLKFLWKLH